MKVRASLIIGVLTSLLSAGSSYAALVTWTLHDLQFDDQGTATGSFIYDATTQSVVDWNLVATGHNPVGPISFAKPAPSCDPAQPPFVCDSVSVAPGPTAGSVKIDFEKSGTPSGSATLQLVTTGALTDQGGTVGLLAGAGFTPPFSANPTGSGFNCCEGIAAGNLTAGAVTSVPEPMSLAYLLVAAILLLGRFSIRQRLRVSKS